MGFCVRCFLILCLCLAEALEVAADLMELGRGSLTNVVFERCPSQ
jgi:hypothetical protein